MSPPKGHEYDFKSHSVTVPRREGRTLKMAIGDVRYAVTYESFSELGQTTCSKLN